MTLYEACVWYTLHFKTMENVFDSPYIPWLPKDSLAFSSQGPGCWEEDDSYLDFIELPTVTAEVRGSCYTFTVGEERRFYNELRDVSKVRVRDPETGVVRMEERGVFHPHASLYGSQTYLNKISKNGVLSFDKLPARDKLALKLCMSSLFTTGGTMHPRDPCGASAPLATYIHLF